MYNKEVKLLFGKNKIQFIYSFNENTKYADLFEYSLFFFQILIYVNAFVLQTIIIILIMI